MEELTIKDLGKARVRISDGENHVSFAKYKKGLYRSGNQKITPELLRLSSLSSSQAKVLTVIGKNEGRLDAINTWDNSFLSFGLFQWTTGPGRHRGELPALLAKVKEVDADTFQQYFKKYGLDVTEIVGTVGFFALHGEKLTSPAEKEQLRTPEWAYRFWRAGQDLIVQLVQLQHALTRLDSFHHSEKIKLRGYRISEYISSEYGVCLLLDNHVNRPGYVRHCLNAALDKAQLSRPWTWDTEDESKFIQAYLAIRETYGRSPMTHAKRRALRTKKYVDSGFISDKRWSFI